MILGCEFLRAAGVDTVDRNLSESGKGTNRCLEFYGKRWISMMTFRDGQRTRTGHGAKRVQGKHLSRDLNLEFYERLRRDCNGDFVDEQNNVCLCFLV